MKYEQFIDLLATIWGTTTGVDQLLAVTHRISTDDGLLISRLATIAFGVVANKQSPRNPRDIIQYSASFPPYGPPLYSEP
jgi:hypothetical protein